MSRPLLGPGPEFDRIRAVAAALGEAARGLGDDAAEIPFRAGVPVVSTDVSVEAVHFRTDWLNDEEIGWRAAMAALSDLAAMGATADGLVVAVTLPADAPEARLTALMRGVGDAATAVGAAVLGGDLSRGPSVALAVTVFGTAMRPVWRGGAQPGDRLWVTGALGGPQRALDAWLAGHAPAPADRVRFARPVARIAQGRALAALGATAMVDLSDGLVADARHIAAASQCRLRIDPAAVPRVDAADLATALTSGEEYELLVALPAAVVPPADLAATCIGAVEAGPPEVVDARDGRPFAVLGHDHFRSR